MKKILLPFILLLFAANVYGQTYAPDAIICQGDSLWLNATSLNADYYVWFKNGHEFFRSEDGHCVITESGSYRAIAFNSIGCPSDTSANFKIVYRTLWTIEDTATVFADSKVDIPILHNDNKGCWEFNVAMVRIVANPAKGVVYINHDGSVQYIPNSNTHGQDQFQYTIDDMHGDRSAPTLVTVTIGNECGIIFPNPTTDKLTVTIQNPSIRYLKLCDMTGKIISIEPARDDIQDVNMAQYADGMYLLQLLDEHGKQVCLFKVIKRGNQ